MKITGKPWQPAIPPSNEGDPKTAPLRTQSMKVEIAAHRVITQVQPGKQNRSLPVSTLHPEVAEKVEHAADRVVY